VSSPAGPTWLVEQLPVGMLEDDFLVRFTSIFQDVADTLVDAVDTIDATADLTLTPDPFVRWLGGWIDAHPNPSEAVQIPGGARERAWIQAQSRALTGRGTRPSLELMLQQLCGDQPVRVLDGGGVYLAGQCPLGDPAWVQVELPALPQVASSDVLDLIRSEVPVHVAVHLIIGGVVVGQVGPGIPRPRTHSAADDFDLQTEVGSGLSPSVRRLPGTAGRAGQQFRTCRACAERNRLDGTDCWRCGVPLDRPVTVLEPEPELEPSLFGPEPESDERRIWPVIVLIVAVVLVLAALVTGVVLL
jgi:phage tail-like protein